jgi:hypothetical protein
MCAGDGDWNRLAIGDWHRLANRATWHGRQLVTHHIVVAIGESHDAVEDGALGGRLARSLPAVGSGGHYGRERGVALLVVLVVAASALEAALGLGDDGALGGDLYGGCCGGQRGLRAYAATSQLGVVTSQGSSLQALKWSVNTQVRSTVSAR